MAFRPVPGLAVLDEGDVGDRNQTVGRKDMQQALLLGLMSGGRVRHRADPEAAAAVAGAFVEANEFWVERCRRGQRGRARRKIQPIPAAAKRNQGVSDTIRREGADVLDEHPGLSVSRCRIVAVQRRRLDVRPVERRSRMT
jgi:hypothetical protein